MNQLNGPVRACPLEEELICAYYAGVGPDIHRHLDECPECHELFGQLSETLALASESAIPARGEGYGAEVWARLGPHLPLQKSGKSWQEWWWAAPVAAALLVLVFTAGMLTEHTRVSQSMPVPDNTAERVLYLALSEHLDQAQSVLTEIAHARPSSDDPELARRRARDLIIQNRLLQQRTSRAGDTADSAVLDDLERVLLEVANGNTSLSAVQRRMEAANLLFRVRISGSDARMKGEKL